MAKIDWSLIADREDNSNAINKKQFTTNYLNQKQITTFKLKLKKISRCTPKK